MVCNLTHDEETQKKVLPYRHNKRNVSCPTLLLTFLKDIKAWIA